MGGDSAPAFLADPQYKVRFIAVRNIIEVWAVSHV
jgi:hypothetical protein